MSIPQFSTTIYYLKALCELWGETANGLLRRAVEKYTGDRNALAATVAYLAGLRDQKHKRAPRRIECIDFVRALDLKEGYDEQRIYGEPSIEAFHVREQLFIHELESLLHEGNKAFHYFIVSLVGDPDKAIEIFTEPRRKDPRVMKYEIRELPKGVEIMLCYHTKKTVDALIRVKYGGINAGVVATAIALKRGFKRARFIEVKRISDNCLLLRYEFIERY